MNDLTPQDIWDNGFEIVKDVETDYFLFKARFWVEDSGLFDTPEEAAEGCRDAIAFQ